MKIMESPKTPFLMKRYWFFHGNEGARQFIFTFGTCGHKFGDTRYSGKYPTYGVLFWGYDPKKGKRVEIDEAMTLSWPPKKPFFFDKVDENYVFRYKDTELEFSSPYRDAEEFGVFGMARGINEYLEFKGRLFGKRIKGKSYFQKVDVSGPFVSWDWMTFQGRQWGGAFHITGKTSASFMGKTFDVKISAGDGNLKIIGDDFEVTTKPYETHTIRFRGFGRFRYTEFLVKVDGKVEGRKLDEYGIVEEARGLIF